MIIRKAIKSDIEILIKLRIDYLTEDGGELTFDEKCKTAENLREYFSKHIENTNNNDFIAAIAEIDGKIIATAFMVINERPVNPRYFITGKTAVILNVLTYSEFRRQGIATKLLELLIEEAKKADVSFIELSATSLGKTVYEKLGFIKKLPSSYTEMRLNLLN
ncbi:MAG: GNAT family N-acetyltransferase [Oscillospiraceae bacterium]|nr:GNAT family N-acetyltransferase [Oscillospiraceae bacterium]